MAIKFKVLILGDNNVGKTALYNTLVNNEKNKKEVPAIKAKITDIFRKIGDDEITVELYDLPAREYLSPNKLKWFKGTDGALIVYDITKADTFRRVPFWLEQLINYNNKGDVPIVLVGNKGDLRESSERVLNPIDPQAFCIRLNRTTNKENIKHEYFEVSALYGKNVTEVLDALIKNMYKHLKK